MSALIQPSLIPTQVHIRTILKQSFEASLHLEAKWQLIWTPEC